MLCFLAKITSKETELPPHGAEGKIHFAFEVTKKEYTSALIEIEGSSIEILHRHLWKNGIRSFYFHDPDNNVVEIIEQGPWD